MMRFLLIALILLPLSAGDALAAPAKKRAPLRVDLIPKTSLDYTMDDGVMSPEEMEMEAQDMFKLCDQNVYQKRYFNCACLAGAFLQQREKLGPLAMQNEIFDIITNSAETNSSCGNVAEVAGSAYSSCMSFSSSYSETELDETNGDFCTCVANKVGRDFGSAPRLSSVYVQQIRSNAMTVCRDPEFRKTFAAEGKIAAAKAEEEKKAAAVNAIPALKTSN